MTVYHDGLAEMEPRPKLDLMEIGRIFSGMSLSDREAIRSEERRARVIGYRFGHPQVPFYIDTKVRDSAPNSRGGIVLSWFRGDGWLLSATIRQKERVVLGGGVFHNVYKADWNYSVSGDRDSFVEAWITAKLLFLGNRTLLPGYEL